MRIFSIAALALLSPWLGAATLEVGRCDCKALRGDCESTIDYSNYWLTVNSSSQQCSLVTATFGDDKKVFKVTDGASRHPWLPGTAEGLKVDSCKVCKDSAFDAAGKKVAYQPEKLKDYSKDLSWLEGAWCWDWQGRPGMSRYDQVEGNSFKWGTQAQTITIQGTHMRSVAADKSYMEREIIDRDTLRLLKHGLGKHEQNVSVIMWRCE